MKAQALFFDATGTLIHLAEPVGHTYARLAEAQGLSVDPSRVEFAFRSTWKTLPTRLYSEEAPPKDDDRSWWRELVARTFAEAAGKAVPEEILEPLFDSLYVHFAKVEAWTLYDDVLSALRELSPGRTLLVVSNFDRRLHSILAGLGLAPFFAHLILSSEVGASKPHPRMFQAALRACGLLAEECLHIGDEPVADGEGAAAMGISSFLVNRPEEGLRRLVEMLSVQRSGVLPGADQKPTAVAAG